MTPSVKNNKKLLPLIKREDLILRDELEKTYVSGFESNVLMQNIVESIDGQHSSQTVKNKTKNLQLG